MQQKAWVEGMKDLATMPDREWTEEMAARRGETYYCELSHLTDRQWEFAVRQSLRALAYFPSIKHLLDFAAEAPEEQKRPGLSPAVLAALKDPEAREAYERERELKGLPKVPVGPSEAPALVKDIRRRSGLDRAAE